MSISFLPPAPQPLYQTYAYQTCLSVMEESDTEESTSTKSDYSSSYVDSESGDTTFLEEEEDEEEIKLKLSPQDLVDAEVGT